MDVTEFASQLKPCVFLTGATGYVGGRLKHCLEELGYPLRCFIRSPISVEKEKSHTKYIVGEISDKKSIIKALEGVDVAFYLIHSMGARGNFAEKDRELAVHFAQAAARQGVKKIIYLGGLGNHYEEKLSAHLRSRHEVGNVLRANAGNVQIIEFRSAIVIGSGSLCYEMIRSLVERLPIMISPKWAYTLAQPISINDLLNYLIKAIDLQFEGYPIFEIGGKDRVSYADLMKEYANQKELKRWMLKVPVLAPRLSSLWLGLVTPLYPRVSQKLVESAICSTVVHDPLATHIFHIQPTGVKETITRAIKNEEVAFPLTRWNDSISSFRMESPSAHQISQHSLTDTQKKIVKASLEKSFEVIQQIAGTQSCFGLIWIRGFIDLLLGGVGNRRGRKNPNSLQVGDVVNCWRVTDMNKPYFHKMQLEMKIPGKAWVEYFIEPIAEESQITQRIIFDPLGIPGKLYWYLMYPLHKFVWIKMLKDITQKVS